MNINNQPFWKDDPEFASTKMPNPFGAIFGIYYIIMTVFTLAIPAFVLALVSEYLSLAWLGFVTLLYALSFYQYRRRKSTAKDAIDTQIRAKDLVGASEIGSAIHVAGHPRLQPEQPIVMALVGDSLNIYDYEHSAPIDKILLKDIQGVYTVAYDDDRVAHLDAIDSVAQAIQLAFLWHGQPCSCLFRRMRKMKPIDWYHSIQKTRLTLVESI